MHGASQWKKNTKKKKNNKKQKKQQPKNKRLSIAVAVVVRMFAGIPKVNLLNAAGLSWISSGFWKYIPDLANGGVFFFFLYFPSLCRFRLSNTNKNRKV